MGYSRAQLAPYFGRQIKDIIHPPLIEYLNSPLGVKLNIYGVLFTTRGCPVGCKFCQTPVFCSKPNIIPLKSIERVLAYYKENGINVVLIEDENFGCNRRHADAVVELLDKYGWSGDAWPAPITCERRSTNGRRCEGRTASTIAGFGGAAIGIENLHQERLDEIKKKEGTEDILETIRMLQKHGLGTVGYYMIGFEKRYTESRSRRISRSWRRSNWISPRSASSRPSPDAPVQGDRREVRHLGPGLSSSRRQAHGLESSPHQAG